VAALGKGGIDVVALAEQLATTPDKATQPSGHRHYFSSDQSVHRRAEYYSSIKMFSKRTKSGELVNNEGLQGSRQSDGRLYLVRKGDEYFGKHLWPAVDWSRLPGVTVEQNGHAANEDYGVGTTTFVGGTSDGQNGVAAMDAAPLKTTLTAKKSWFFFDDFIVFLGSDISDTATSPVETIVEQWPLSTTTQPLVADGVQVAAGPYSATLPKASALTCDGLGYFFPGGADVKAEIKDQTGDWSSLGVSNGSVSGRFLTLSLSHGTKPAAAKYSYAIALAEQDLSTWKTSAPFTVLANDSRTAAVRAGTSAAVVFWAAGSLEVVPGVTLGADTPSVAFITDDGATFSIAAADPAQGSGKATFTVSGTFVDGSADDGGATVDFAHGIVQIDRAQGATHSAKLVRQAPSTPDAGAASNPDASVILPGDDASFPSEPPDARTATDASVATANADAGASIAPAGCGCAHTGSGALGGVVLWLLALCVVRQSRAARPR